jgi:hypothetical protein
MKVLRQIAAVETVTFAVGFAARLAAGETIITVVSATATIRRGSGAPTILTEIAGSDIAVRASDVVAASWYVITVLIETSAGNRHEGRALLRIRA